MQQQQQQRQQHTQLELMDYWTLRREEERGSEKKMRVSCLKIDADVASRRRKRSFLTCEIEARIRLPLSTTKKTDYYETKTLS